LYGLGVASRWQGRHEEKALDRLRKSLAIFERLHTTDAGQVRALLAKLPDASR
jgi:hypothetical protein